MQMRKTLGKSVQIKERHQREPNTSSEKRGDGPAPGPETSLWGSQLCSSQLQQSISKFSRATPGSAGLDLCSTSHTVLTLEMGAQALNTGIYGPLLSQMFGLIIGRSSVIMKGLQIYPEVIHNDYTGEMKVMTKAVDNIITIAQGERVTQFILLPLNQTDNKIQHPKRGDRVFGSSNIYWVQEITAQKPSLKLWLDGKLFTGLID